MVNQYIYVMVLAPLEPQARARPKNIISSHPLIHCFCARCLSLCRRLASSSGCLCWLGIRRIRLSYFSALFVGNEEEKITVIINFSCDQVGNCIRPPSAPMFRVIQAVQENGMRSNYFLSARRFTLPSAARVSLTSGVRMAA